MMEQGVGEGFTVAMARATEPPGVDIIDPIERRRCTLLTDGVVTPREGDIDAFRFPVETAVEVDTTGITAPFTGHAIVRNDVGEIAVEVSRGVEHRLPSGPYSIELARLTKVYLRVDSTLEIAHSGRGIEIRFDEETTVAIGSRSAHSRPATTVTTTDDPVDILSAISTFGSALKTTSPERTFPTLRGHPPTIEIGDEFDRPAGLTPPVDDLRIEVPPRYEYVYPVAPLAYYLGVAAEVGQVPRIVGEDFEFALTHPMGFDRAVHEVLRQVFLLECATRTEGLYPLTLYEKEQLRQRVDLPFSALYEAGTVERLSTYLDIPYAVIEDVIPDWRLAAHVDPVPESAPMLPYLSKDLALITMAEPEVLPATAISSGMTAGFTRGASDANAGDLTLVRPQGGPPALETAWIGAGTPVGATKSVTRAYENRLGRTPQERSIEIAVVCNSSDMAEERQIVDEVYGTHEEMPFSLELHESLATEELATLLRRDFNFIHYIGHIDESGFRCTDGRLDLRAIDEIGPEAFFLNACQSYEQGIALVEGGAIGGIVTLNDVVNHGAVRIGQAVARLLNGGFPLRAALDIASHRSVIGQQYMVVGDGNLSIVQPPSGTSQMYHVRRCGDGTYAVTVEGFGSPPGMGCMFASNLDGLTSYHLSTGMSPEVRVDADELRQFLRMEDVPVALDEDIIWSHELSPARF